MNTTQVFIELARTARSCAQTAAHPERRAAYQQLERTAHIHAERWGLTHPHEIDAPKPEASK